MATDTDGTATQTYLAIYEYDGFLGTPTLDQSAAGNTGIGGSTSIPTGTTSIISNSNELLFAAVSKAVTDTVSAWSNSLTTLTTLNPVAMLVTADRIVSSGGAYSTTATVGISSTAEGAIATFYDDYNPPVNNRYLDTVMNDTPVSFWILNEISGTAAKDQMAVQNGVYTGGYTQGAAGIVLNENVYSTTVDGASGQITVANNSNQQPGTGDWTVECWVYPTNLTGTQGIFIKDTSAGYSNPPWGLVSGGTTSSFTITNSGNTTYSVNHNVATSNNNPHHLVGLFDASANTITIYKDGVLGTNTTTTTGSIGSPTGTCRIGQQKNTFNRWFFGKIQYCAIYNKLLTPTQISNHYNAGSQANFKIPYMGV